MGVPRRQALYRGTDTRDDDDYKHGQITTQHLISLRKDALDRDNSVKLKSSLFIGGGWRLVVGGSVGGEEGTKYIAASISLSFSPSLFVHVPSGGARCKGRGKQDGDGTL